jgi:acetate kinase
MRDVLAAAAAGNDRAATAIEIFVRRLVEYIGSYHTLLGGADAIVFAGGIGENSRDIRARVVARLGVLGCHLDASRNDVIGQPALITTDASQVKAVVMPTNEELMIARETRRLLDG